MSSISTVKRRARARVAALWVCQLGRGSVPTGSLGREHAECHHSHHSMGSSIGLKSGAGKEWRIECLMSIFQRKERYFIQPLSPLGKGSLGWGGSSGTLEVYEVCVCVCNGGRGFPIK